MKRTGIAILVIVLLLSWGTCAFAQEMPPILTEAHFYTGILFYCDGEEQVVVLKDVSPVGKENEKSSRTAEEAEYLEIPVVGPALKKDNTPISLEDCNYFPDSEVRVLITRNALGELRVMQLKFQ